MDRIFQEKMVKTLTGLAEGLAVLAEKARSGFRAEVKALLAKRNVNQLSEITDPLELGALVMEAEQLHINP